MDRYSNPPQNEDKICDSQDELNRFTILGKFASILFHEIGSSLCKMKMNLDVYKDEFAKSSELDKVYQTFQNEINRLNKLSNEIKQFSRPSLVIPAKINLFLFFESIKEQILKKLKDKRITFINNAIDNSIIGDYSKLQTAFLCMINSSIDSMEDDGVLAVESDLLKDDGLLLIIIRFKGNDLNFIDLLNQYENDRISESGLSLLIFKQMIIDLGGSVNFLSVDNENSVIEVQLSCDLNG